MFMSLRDGKAGLGSDHLYLYRSSTGFWEFVGTPLTGVQSNPYVHGWDFRNGKLHVTWVYRGFVHYEGWDDLKDTKHKQQAGPNGAENNHNMCYAYSEDLGYSWKNGNGKVIADLRKGETIDNSSEGIVAFDIPKGSGLMNQEAQAVDQDGGVHVLNRDTLDGINVWRHYHRAPGGMLPCVQGQSNCSVKKATDRAAQAPGHRGPSAPLISRGEVGWRSRRLATCCSFCRIQLRQ